MRVAFAGASGTGKTWLAERLAAEHGLPINPVGSRKVAHQMGFQSPYEVDKAGRRTEFQRELLRQKIDWEQSRTSYLSDRTTLDNLAYAILHDVHGVDPGLLSASWRHFHHYTHVVVCLRCGFHRVGDDPARIKDPTYHELYELLLLALINRYAGPHTRIRKLYTSDPEYRLEQCRQFIRQP